MAVTGEEWRASVNAPKMIASVRDKGSERIWRLFGVACARGAADRTRDPRGRKALEVAERFADGAEAAARQAGRDLWV
ncbi:MAG: hypothetical protein ACRC33_31015, partial [Gemmataceae bacterium]